MEKHIKHLRYILVHKWFVLIECCKLGIPWLGITHDLSKFSKAEWHPCLFSFYLGWKQSERPQWVIRLFEKALEHHFDCNKHHWEHWLSKVDGRRIPAFAIEMPDCYRKEMLADWIGAGRAKKKGDPHHEGISEVAVWYQKHKDKIKLHPETRRQAEEMLKEKHGLVI